MLEELLAEAMLCDRDRCTTALERRGLLLAELERVAKVERSTPMETAAEAARREAGERDALPWGGPGPAFIGRRRAWLHQLLSALHARTSNAMEQQ